MPTLPLVRLTVLGAAAVAAVSLTGCGVVFNSLQDGLIRPDTVTEVRLTGSSGDLRVVRDDSVAGVDIRRTSQYRGDGPRENMRVENGVVFVDTDCGAMCTSSFEVRLPHREAGVKVTGDISSGDITLHDVSDVDLHVSSGSIEVTDASGTVKAEATSGDVTLVNVAGNATVTVTSGDIEARGLRGATNRMESTSGDVTLSVSGTGAVSATATSGNVSVTVPDRTVIVTADVGSGERRVDVTDGPTGSPRLDLRTGSGDIVVRAA